MPARVRARRTERERPLMPVVISPGSSLVRSAAELNQSCSAHTFFRVTNRIIGKRAHWTRRSPQSRQEGIQNERTQEIKGTGYIVDSLEAALWAFDRSRSFRVGALLAVNLGNDADTTGAIYGQLAGAFYGAEQIPPEWMPQMNWATAAPILNPAAQL